MVRVEARFRVIRARAFFVKEHFPVRQIPDDLFFRYLPKKLEIFYLTFFSDDLF